MSNAAAKLNTQLFQEDWASAKSKDAKTEAKISYLMVEKITPPDHLWEKVSKKLEQQTTTADEPLKLAKLSSRRAIAIMVTSAAASIALMLYWLL